MCIYIILFQTMNQGSLDLRLGQSMPVQSCRICCQKLWNLSFMLHHFQVFGKSTSKDPLVNSKLVSQD